MSKASNEFKNTKIGLFPIDWKVEKLIKLLDSKKELIVGGPFGSNLMVKDYRERGIPIIRLQNVEYFRFINQDIKYISPEKAEELKYHSFQKGDIVLAKLGDPVGKTCIVPEFLKRGIVTADVVRIRPINKDINRKFLMYVLNSYFIWKQLTRDVIGSTRPRVNLDHIRNLIIPLPSLVEQQSIASILSNLDDIIQIIKNIIYQLRALKKGLMQRLFTEGIGHTEFKQTRLGKIPKEWEIAKFNNLIKYEKGKKPITFYEKNNNTYKPYLSTEYLREGKETKYVNTMDDVIIADKKCIILIWDGSNAGEFFLGQDGIVSSTMVKINPTVKEIDLKYLFYICISKERELRRQTRGTGIPHVDKMVFQNLKIQLPSIEEQKKIAGIFFNIDKKIENEKKYKKKLKIIKKGLMQDLLTGKKRVKIKN